MFAESVHCQLSVAKGNGKVVPRTRTGYCEWSVAEGVVAALYDADVSFRWSECPPFGFSNELAIVDTTATGMPGLPACTVHGSLGMQSYVVSLTLKSKKHLFLVVFFQRVFKSFFEPSERNVHLSRPPDLDATERHLSREVKQPLLARLIVISRYGFRQLMTNCTAHWIQHSVQPHFHLPTQNQ